MRPHGREYPTPLPAVHPLPKRSPGAEMNDLTPDDIALTVKLAGCSLATTPGKDNWVDDAGGLPEYICEVARSIKKSGKTTSQAIAIAVSRIKKWALTGEPETKAKAAKALAQWEKMKSKSHGKTVKATMRDDGSEYIMLSAVNSYNMDRVREAFNAKEREKRDLIEQANTMLRAASPYSPMEAIPCDYRYVREVWTDFLIVEDGKSPAGFVQIPYTVGAGGVIAWGKETSVVQEYVALTATDRIKVALSRGNDRPGRQVASAAGAAMFGKPIGADIAPGARVKFKKNGVRGRVVSVHKPSINSGSNDRVITWQDDAEKGNHVHKESALELDESDADDKKADSPKLAQLKKGMSAAFSQHDKLVQQAADAADPKEEAKIRAKIARLDGDMQRMQVAIDKEAGGSSAEKTAAALAPKPAPAAAPAAPAKPAAGPDPKTFLNRLVEAGNKVKADEKAKTEKDAWVLAEIDEESFPEADKPARVKAWKERLLEAHKELQRQIYAEAEKDDPNGSDNLPESDLANAEGAHDLATQVKPGGKVTRTAKSGKKTTYVKLAKNKWKIDGTNPRYQVDDYTMSQILSSPTTTKYTPEGEVSTADLEAAPIGATVKFGSATYRKESDKKWRPQGAAFGKATPQTSEWLSAATFGWDNVEFKKRAANDNPSK